MRLRARLHGAGLGEERGRSTRSSPTASATATRTTTRRPATSATTTRSVKLPWGALPEGYCRNYADADCPWRSDRFGGYNPGDREGPQGRDYYGRRPQGRRPAARLPRSRSASTRSTSTRSSTPASNHGYDTQDYTTIDPYFGTQKDFDNLVKHAARAAASGSSSTACSTTCRRTARSSTATTTTRRSARASRRRLAVPQLVRVHEVGRQRHRAPAPAATSATTRAGSASTRSRCSTSRTPRSQDYFLDRAGQRRASTGSSAARRAGGWTFGRPRRSRRLLGDASARSSRRPTRTR